MKDKLRKIQNTLSVPKNQRNSFGNYNYRSCEDILEAVKPLLGDLTLVLEDELVNIGDRYYVKATATLSDDKDSIKVSAYAREEETKKGMDGSQITGASSSYARKYALNGLFLIDDTKDSDSTNDHAKDGAASETEAPKKEELEDGDYEVLVEDIYEGTIKNGKSAGLKYKAINTDAGKFMVWPDSPFIESFEKGKQYKVKIYAKKLHNVESFDEINVDDIQF